MSTSVSAQPERSAAPGQPTPDDTPHNRRLEESPAARRDRIIRRWVTWISALLILGVLILILQVQGRVNGTEFSPTHFQQRQFSFYEIPLVHLQITPIRRKAISSRTGNYLRLNSLINSGNGPPKVWHLVSITRGLTGATVGAAQLLTEPMNLDADGEYWRRWSVDHPEHAKILWPMLQELALRELYVLIPPLLEIAQLDQDPGELRAELERRLKREYQNLVTDLRAADDHGLASEILAEAIQSFPQDPELQKLLSPASD